MSPRSRSPPRMPSPQLIPTPLPSPPHSRSRAHSRIAPSLRHPLLGPPPLEKRIHASRSYDTFSPILKSRNLILHCDEFGTHRKAHRAAPAPASRHNSIPSPPATPRSLPIPIPARRRSPCTSLSFAVPYRSPPPSPTIASPPPPVPPIPAFALSSTDKKPVLHSQERHHLRQTSPSALYHPSSTDPVTMASKKQLRPVAPPRGESGMTCQKCFALRSSIPRDILRTMAV